MAMVRQFDEDLVLEKVLEVFWAKGWQATSMADLASAAKVQRGSLYHAYGDKEQLFVRAFDRYATRVLEESRVALEASSARTALQRFFNAAITSMTINTPPRGCFTTKTAVESGAISVDVRDRVRKLVESLEASIVQVLSRDDVRSELNLPPDRAAQLIIAFTRGLAVMERIYQDSECLCQISDDLIDLLVKPEVGR